MMRATILRLTTGLCLAAGTAGGQSTDGFGLPGLYGLRIAPAYDRVDGLSLPWGPRYRFPNQRGEVNAELTYRSNRGIVDPRGELDLALPSQVSLSVRGGRETRSNDGWIRPGVANAVSTLLAGEDMRNYYTAKFADVSLSRAMTTSRAEVAPLLGVSWEDARSILLGRSAFSLLERQDSINGMRRPNPPIVPGRTTSIHAGVTARHQLDDVTIMGQGILELPASSPYSASWSQLTLDAGIDFPTFGSERLDLHTHVVTSWGDSTPPQRYVFLGGGGTFATTSNLAGGGDRLFLLETSYVVPLPWPRSVPILGPPVVSIRHLVGAVGVGTLPSMVQNIGARVTWGYLGIEWLLDPDTHKSAGQAVFLSGR